MGGDTGLALAVDRLGALDMTEGRWISQQPFHVGGAAAFLLISERDSVKTLGPAVARDGRYI